MRIKTIALAENIYRISVSKNDRFEFNHFLIVDERSVLVHTGREQWFELLKKEARNLVDLEKIAYIAFSHFEADECGSLNQWLQAAPNAVPFTNRTGRASIEDFSLRKPQLVSDGQKINLGAHTLQILETPHFPHNWDAMLFFEEKEKILFASDLGAHWGAGELATETDITEDILAFQRTTRFMPAGKDLVRGIKKLEKLGIKYLATMHGSTLYGDNIARLLTSLEEEFGCTL